MRLHLRPIVALPGRAAADAQPSPIGPGSHGTIRPCASTTASTTSSRASAGFYRTWYVYVGLELGLLQRLRDAGASGLTADELAQRTGTEPRLVRRLGVGRRRARPGRAIDGEPDHAVPTTSPVVLLDADRPEYLGGQFLHAAIGSLDFAHLPEVFRSGHAASTGAPGPLPRGHRAADGPGHRGVLPGGAGGACRSSSCDLQPGARILDVHCGGGRWLIAMARRFPGTTPGRRRVRARLRRPRPGQRRRRPCSRDRITHRAGRRRRRSATPHEATLAYFQYALHQLADPSAALRVRVGRRSARTAGSWRSTGTCRPTPTSSARRHARADRGRAAGRAGPGHAARVPHRGARLVRRRRGRRRRS